MNKDLSIRYLKFCDSLYIYIYEATIIMQILNNHDNEIKICDYTIHPNTALNN